MCGVWRNKDGDDLTTEVLDAILSDAIFRKVRSVGINGGEPTLLQNLPGIVEAILSLPSLRAIHLSTNGFFRESTFQSLRLIKRMCSRRGVSFNILVSLDGVDLRHDAVRGVKKAFGKTVASIDRMKSHQGSYCDTLQVSCTVVKQNSSYLVELDEFCKAKGYSIRYRLGVANLRICSDRIMDGYSVLTDRTATMAAREFFYKKMREADTHLESLKYYSLFRYLCRSSTRRLMGCKWQYDGITIDPVGNVYYCAVASKKIGSLVDGERHNGTGYLSRRSLRHRRYIRRHLCRSCLHDYSGRPSLDQVVNFVRFRLKQSKF